MTQTEEAKTRWTELKMCGGSDENGAFGLTGCPYGADWFVGKLREFRRTGGMLDVFFARIGAAHEDPEDASTWGPRRESEIDWTGFPEGRYYGGWTIRYDQPESNLFGETDPAASGVDREASARRYCELLEDAIEREFPGARVCVMLDVGGSAAAEVECVVPDGTGHEAMDEAEAAVLQRAEAVWEAHNWYLDRLYSQTEFAQALAEAFPSEIWNTETIGSYRTRGLAGIPEPRQYVGKHPAWTWSQVQEYVADRRKRESTPSGPRPTDSTYDRDCAQATTALLDALREGGYEVETPVTGSVIIGHILEIASGRVDALAMQWAAGEFETVDDLAEHVHHARDERAERAEEDRVETARDAAEEEGGI